MLGRDFIFVPLIPALLVASISAIRRSLTFWQTLALLTFVSYVGAVVSWTMFPLPVDPRLIADETAMGCLRNNLVPLATITDAFNAGPTYFLVQVLGNLVLLAPLGVLLPSLWPRARQFWLYVAIAAGAAVSIELAQLLVSMLLGYTYRQVDVDDLIMNVSGALLGFVLFRAAFHTWHALPASLRRNRTRRVGGVCDGSEK